MTLKIESLPPVAEMMRVSDGANDLYYVRCTDTENCGNRSEVEVFPMKKKVEDPTLSFLNPLIEEWNTLNPIVNEMEDNN